MFDGILNTSLVRQIYQQYPKINFIRKKEKNTFRDTLESGIEGSANKQVIVYVFVSVTNYRCIIAS